MQRQTNKETGLKRVKDEEKKVGSNKGGKE